MRILYHHRILAADGMQVHIKELTAALERCGHEIAMVGPDTVSSAGKPTLTGRLGALRSHLPAAFGELLEAGYNLKAYRQLKEEAQTFRPDIIYERYNSFLLAGLWLKRALGIPLLVEANSPLCHERKLLGNLKLERLARSMERQVWREADAVLPVSHAIADFVRKENVPDERIHVIPNGVRPEVYKGIRDGVMRKALQLEDKIVFGFVGYIRPWHGLDRVLHAFKNLENPSLHLLIVGEGPASDGLKSTASDLGLSGQLTFTGRQPHHKIPAFLGAMDVALQPDVNAYASPLKLFEYLAAGCAIIAPDRPNIRELVTSGETALLINPEQDGELETAIRTLANDHDLRSRLGHAAIQHINDREFTWDANARRVAAIADAALGAA